MHQCCVITEGCTVPWWLWSGCRWVDPGAPRQRAARCQSCPWSGRRWCGRAPRRSSPCLGTFWSHGAAWTARLSLHRLGRGGVEGVKWRNISRVSYSITMKPVPVTAAERTTELMASKHFHCLPPALLMCSKSLSGTMWGANCANHLLSPPLQESLR